MNNENIEREKVIKQCGGDVLVNGNFNPIFGQTRKIFREKYGTVIEQVNEDATPKKSHK